MTKIGISRKNDVDVPHFFQKLNLPKHPGFVFLLHHIKLLRKNNWDGSGKTSGNVGGEGKKVPVDSDSIGMLLGSAGSEIGRRFLFVEKSVKIRDQDPIL